MALSAEHIISSLKSQYGSSVTSAEVRAWCAMNDVSYPTVTGKIEQYKIGRGKWNLTTQEKLEQTYQAPAAMPAVEQNLIPQKDDTFVKFGNFGDIRKILESRLFYPSFITGLSGNGKTFCVEQACAQLNRELIRVNITIETDEDDLIGGFRLVNGETVWHNGPVVEALQRGAVLLLDEVDPGFNVIATANTKGKGSDDGRFIGTNVLNEAFLERFCVTFEQAYPDAKLEQKILQNVAKQVNVSDVDFCKHLCDWADIIRKTFYDGGIDEVISTRRLVHIVRAYSIFGNKEKAMQVCINRFDDETKQAFLELYDKVDGEFKFEYTATGEKVPLDQNVPF
jgi:hypothetical protein